MSSRSMRLFLSVIALVCLILSIVLWLRDPSAQPTEEAMNGAALNEDFPLRAIDRLPARQIEYWKPMLAKPLSERVFVAPVEVLEYLKADNLFQGYSEIPAAPSDPEEKLRLARSTLSSFPAPLQRRIEKQLAGLALVRNLGGSAIANWVVGSNTGFIALDVEALDKKANDWASWRDGTPFKNGRYRLRTTIASAGDDSMQRAYDFVILHEIAHVLSIGENFHPSWDDPKPLDHVNLYPFTNISWKAVDGDWMRVSDVSGAPLPKLPFYAKEDSRLPNEELPKAHESLLQSPFITMYGATGVYDDFAESFATYIHTQVMKRPYYTEIFDGDKLVKRIDLCYGKSEARCALKEQLIREFYERL